MDHAVVKAYAKINLGLRVLGKREDGYHNILSVFQTLDLADRLSFERIPSGAIEIVCEHPDVPTDSSNLAFKAIEIIREATGCSEGLRIIIDKKIPVGAGLGGGSSDAAAVLRFVNRIWKIDLSIERLAKLACKLGSDVPFFLRSGTAIVSGRGEHIQYVSWTRKVYYALVYPGVQISTQWAFENLTLNLTKTSVYYKFVDSVDDRGFLAPNSLMECLENDFLTLVEGAHPEVGESLNAMANQGASACSLSGSGSTIYGVFWERKEARRAVDQLKSCGLEAYLCRPQFG